MAIEVMATAKNVVVDLDGTLIKGDILHESIFLFLKQNIIGVFLIFYWLSKGRAYLKGQLARRVCPDVRNLPYNEPLMRELSGRKSRGERLLLVTATNQKIAERINEHLGLFDEIKGTDGKVNLAGVHKTEWLEERFAGESYEYYGNSDADMPVWRASDVAHVVNASRSTLKRAEKIGNIGSVITPRSGLHPLIKAIRPHQWLKNLLVLVPLIAAHKIFNLEIWLNSILAFAAFCACASSVYLLNDALDIEDDRVHKTKKKRAIPSGELSLLTTAASIVLLLAFALVVSVLLLPFEFVIVLTIYYLVTLLYSFGLKKVVMLDVILLALLYTIRVIAGATATELPLTFWILAFSLFIFLSLAFVKRYTELWGKQKRSEQKTPGRGYYSADFELLSSLGGASGYLSVLILALYINDATSSMLYRTPQLMWLACPLLLFWLSWVWLIAHRGKMHDDPIVFAVKDKVSRYVGVIFLATFVLAATVSL